MEAVKKRNPLPHSVPFSPEEIEVLELAAECEEFCVSPMWRKMESFLNAMVEEQQDAMRKSRSSNPVVSHNLQLKWREREFMRDCIISFVKGPIAIKKQIIEQLEMEKSRA